MTTPTTPQNTAPTGTAPQNAAPPAVVRWQTAGDRGKRRTNEDAYDIHSGSTDDPLGDHAVAVVCDGLGGHTAGDVASKTAVDAFMSAYVAPKSAGGSTESVRKRLDRALEAANQAIWQAVADKPELGNMGTTLTACAVTRDGVEWVSAGDSPLYLVRVSSPTRCKALNTRHNEPHNANRLTSCLLGDRIPIICQSGDPVPIRPDEIILIASDGLDTIGSRTIIRVLKENQGPDAAAQLVATVLAKRKLKQDNISVVLTGAGL